MEPMRSAFIQKQPGTGRAFLTAKINASEKKDALAIFIMTRVLKIVENRIKSRCTKGTQRNRSYFIFSTHQFVIGNPTTNSTLPLTRVWLSSLEL
jgi:hypothetical protein